MRDELRAVLMFLTERGCKAEYKDLSEIKQAYIMGQNKTILYPGKNDQYVEVLGKDDRKLEIRSHSDASITVWTMDGSRWFDLYEPDSFEKLLKLINDPDSYVGLRSFSGPI